MSLGNTLIEKTQFNSRLQPTQIKLGTAANPASVLELDYTYGVRTNNVLDPLKNNGNIEGQRILISGLDVTQSYTYDQCNRLLMAVEKTTSGQVQQWKQTFTYDRFGNRNFDTNPGQTTLLEANPFFDSNTMTNHFQAGQGYSYDEAGNVTQEPSSPTNKSYIYDAENRQTQFNYNLQTTRYDYDGDGRRVKKTSATNTVLVMVYNAVGQLIAEYDSATTTSSPYQTKYLMGDHLGSTRVITDASGGPTARFDYLPFGSEIGAGIGGRTTTMMYSANTTLRQRFTSKERDNESGLDYFGARYYSGAQGRFTGADPIFISDQQCYMPQSWNLYNYTTNNPLFYVDPDGRKSRGFGQANLKGYVPTGIAFDLSVFLALNPHKAHTLDDPAWKREGLPNPSQSHRFLKPNIPNAEGYGIAGAWETYEEHNVTLLLTLRIEYDGKGVPTAFIDLSMGLSIEPKPRPSRQVWSPFPGWGQPPPSIDGVQINPAVLQSLSDQELQAVARTASSIPKGVWSPLAQAINEAVIDEQRRREEELRKMREEMKKRKHDD